MPRPNVTTPVNLKEHFEKGLTWEAWLGTAESPAQADKMRAKLADAAIPDALRQRLAGLKRTVHVLAIAEDWCGDVVQNAPAIQAIAQAAEKVIVRFAPRTPEVMVRYLTNGAEAIPKFVFLTDKWVEVANWGPRPEVLKLAMARAKAAGDASAAYPTIMEFYQTDRHQTVLAELVALIDIAVNESLA